MTHRLYLPKFKIDANVASIIDSTDLAATEPMATERNVNRIWLNEIIYAAAAVAAGETKYYIKNVQNRVSPLKQTL